ncbi:MAG: GGDEF domain-containing protein [Sulfuriflexus sp.]|nr:GGDEF domain-containing protein [Sulfuriflexus sp.]
MNRANNINNSLTTEMLATQNILRGESQENLAWLLKHSEQHAYNAGDVLLTPEKNNHILYLVLKGRVQVRLDWQGHEALAYLEEGHCVGEMSIIEGKRPSAIVVTEQDCELLLIEKNIVWELIERSSAVARNLLYILSSRVRKDNLVIFESRQQQAISEQNSKIDALTNLYNRRWLDETLPGITERAHKDSQDFCILMLDIDHFKLFNDNYGHHAGDAALTSVAETMANNIRPYDSAARYGGEEFIILLPDTTATEARIIAERLKERIRNNTVTDTNGRRLPMLTVSIGMAELKRGQDMSAFVEAADAALYRAKDSGRNCVAI